MDQYLISLTTLRRLEWPELKPLLPKMDGKLWLLGTKGSRRLVERVNIATPDQWQQACERGLVYIEWRGDWAFAPDLDEKTHLPLLMVPYAEAFRLANAPAQEQAQAQPAQTTLPLQTAPAPAA